VAALKDLVDALVADSSAEPKKDPTELYARVKAASRDLERIWGGFADANDYQECLCRGLTCSMTGRKVLAQLEGEKAMADCQEKAQKARCQWLAEHIVEETLAAIPKVCPPDEPCENGGEPYPYES